MTAASRAGSLAAIGRGVEVLVIGGGITGAGVALDAASRGYRVGLVEQADYAGGTSSRSTKLVHGGIRYLPQGHLALVREGLRERGRLLRLAPHLVHPLSFIVPLYAGLRRPLGVWIPSFLRPFAPLGIRVGLAAYDLFARDPALHHQTMSRAQVERQVPDLKPDGLRGALVYYDARADDVRLTHAVLATARAHGAATCNYAAVRALRRDGDRIAGAAVEDRLTGRSFEVSARFVVNATGIWGEQIAALDPKPEFRIRHSKGSHLVLRPGAVAHKEAIVIPETDDGRLAFIVPWAGRHVLGTTDDAYDGDLSSPLVTGGDVDYLLDHANRYLRRPLGSGDVTGAFAGIRPLVASASGPTSVMGRDHHVAVSPGGLISIVGGKLTGYRAMAEDTVDAIAARDGTRRPCRTADLPLAGGAGLEQARAALAAAGLAPDQQVHLLESYGAASLDVLALMKAEPALAGRLVAGFAATAAEVVYACRAEQASMLTDCMFLRTRLAVLDAGAADAAVETVASLMAAELGWDAAEVCRQREFYEEQRERESSWKISRAL
ncbi:MAG: glycerol-3-phosphate dehydrogenase/oxidase [Armatimonadetes bacterium]|nr:glycerol-3-phosphate dehydrogenase/oxidase [Armatimonadota bacterium]